MVDEHLPVFEPAELGRDIPTDRLVLLPARRVHAAGMFPVLSEPSLYQYMHDQPPASQSALADRFAYLESRTSPDGREVWLNWIVQELASGQFVGYVQATVSSAHTDIAWVIGLSWQRLGYATEAAKAMVLWLRSHGVSVFRAMINPMHIASQRVAAKVGLMPTHQAFGKEELWLLTA